MLTFFAHYLAASRRVMLIFLEHNLASLISSESLINQMLGTSNSAENQLNINELVCTMDEEYNALVNLSAELHNKVFC